MKIFMCGGLGEVIKKVIELGDAIKENPSNNILIASLAAYQNVLNMWPVQDKKEVDQILDMFKFSIANLREKEQELRDQTTVAFYDMQAKNKYLKALDEVRYYMSKLNELGQLIGESPILEVEDADA